MIHKIAKSTSDVKEVLLSMDDGDKIFMRSDFINWTISRKRNFGKQVSRRTDGFIRNIDGKPIFECGLKFIAKEIMRHRKEFNDYMRQEIAIQEEEGR